MTQILQTIDPLARRICDVYAKPPSINGIVIVEPEKVEEVKVEVVAKPPKPLPPRPTMRLTLDELAVARFSRLANVERALNVKPRCADLVERCAAMTRLSPKDIVSTKRASVLVNVRSAIVYVLRQRTDMTFPQIGRIIGRDHSSVIHMMKIARAQITQCPTFTRLVTALGGDVEPEQ